ncbi:unnamed protein product [Allacma fusca]|uniref:Uncharacterized protein n=1 Tax=Allacma fusca TaxID=39272 RepID=A0A8J2JEJ3_9HEXA|nr:unnamed protein product [Allacma fusca]
MRVRSSSLLRRHPSEIYSGIGSYIQRTNSQISNSQRSATSGPMGFDQFREEIIHSGEHRDQDFSVNNIHEGPINTGFTPIAIGIAEVETSEARISSGSTRSEKLSIDKIRSRTLEAIPESSPSNSPEELNTSNNLEMDILSAAEFSNAVVANSTKVSTRQNDRTRISSVTNKSERIRSASHKRMQKLENDNDTRETGNNDTLTSKRSSLPDPQTQIEDVFLKVSSKEAVDSVLGSERQSNSPIIKVIRADPTIGSKSVKSPSAMPQSSVSFKNSPQANASMKNTTTISTKTSEEHAPIPSNEGSSKIQGKRGHEPVSTSSWKHLSIAESNSDENDEILEKSQRSSASKLILRNKIHGSVIADIDELRLENSKDSAAARVSSIGKSSRVNKYSSSGEKLHDAIGSGKPELSQSKKRLAVVDNSDSDEEMISSSSDENDEILEKSQHSAVSKLILRNKSYGSVIADIDELRLEKSKDSAAARISSTEKSSRVNKYSSSGDAIGSGKTEHSQSKKRLAVVDNSDSDEEMISRTSMKTLNKKRPPHAESSDDDLAENTITRLSSSAKSQLFVENSDQNLQEIKASKVKNYSRKNSSFETENTDCNADSNVLRNSLVRSFSHKTNKSSNQPQPLTSSRTTSLQASESQQFLRKDPSRDILFADDSGMQRNKQESSMHRSNAGRVLRLPSESESELPAPSRTSSPNCSPKGSPAKHVTVDLADKTETVHLAHRSCLEPENVIVIAKDIDLRIEDANDEGATSNIISVIDSQIRETPHRKISGRLKSSKISFEKSPERHHPTVFVEKSQSDDDSSDASVDKETSHCQNLLLARTSQKKKTSDKPPSFNTSKQTSVLHSESSPSKSQSINPHRKISGRQKSSKIIFEKSPERHPTVFVEKSQSGDDSSDASVDKETSHCENLLLARTSPKKKTSDEPPSFSTSKQALVLHSESSSSKSQNRNKRKSTMTPGSSDNDSVSLTVKKSYSKRGRMAESVEDNNKNSHDLTAGNQAAPVVVAIIEEDISAGKKSATRKRKLVGNTQQDHDSGSQGRINLLPSVASSEIPSTSRGSRFQTKSTKKAPTRKPKKDFGYYRNNAGIVKKEHVMAGLQVIGVKANKSRVEALTTFASKELENMLDELMASTTKDRDNGIFTYRELELALKRRKLLDPDLGKNALLLHMASVWDRTAYDKAKGVLLPKIGSYNT